MLHAFKKIRGFLKKAFIVIVVYCIVISIFSSFINKDKPKASNNLIESNQNEIYSVLNDKELNSTKQGRLGLGLYRTALCVTIGEACTDNPKDGNKNFNKSILGYMTNLTILPFINPPASGVYWAASGLQNAGFIPNIYAAQGIGFVGLRPFVDIWKVFRDFSYILLVIVLIAISFMIMFRVKLDPQTVIGVENSLPKIVITLIIITFSFAIAGFLIDLMYVSMSLIISIMSNGGTFYDIGKFQNKYLSASSGELFNSFFASDNKWGGLLNLLAIGGIFTDLFTLLPSAITAFVSIITRSIVGFFAINLIFKFLTLLVGTSFENIDIATFSLGTATKFITIPLILAASIAFGISYAPVILAGILGILIILTIVFLFFRVFFLLFAAYLKIIFMIIFAPIFLLLNAIPGKNLFGYWLKSLLGELITFPIVLTLLLTGYIITNQWAHVGEMWKPPFLGALNPNALLVFFGMGMIFMIPNFVKIVKELLGLKPMPISMGLGTFFSGASTGVGGATGILGQFGSISMGISGLKTMGLLGKDKPVPDTTLTDAQREILARSDAEKGKSSETS